MIVIGADHGGYKLKEVIKEYLNSKNIEFIDVGTYSEDSVDYPYIAEKETHLFGCLLSVGAGQEVCHSKALSGYKRQSQVLEIHRASPVFEYCHYEFASSVSQYHR